MEISWKKDLGKELLKDPGVRRDVLRNAEQSVKRFRCPNHGDPVTVSIGSETSQGFQLQLEGCCDEAVDSARQLIGAE